MAIELARTMTRPRPWGTADQLPWHKGVCSDVLVGEVSFERADGASPEPSLLLKLLFTSQSLSIQVHPDDAHAQSMGLPNGKTEAWYVLSARPGAKVALGLKLALTQDELRKAADNGSISDLIAWQDVSKDDVVSVPAGTIHTIGAGLAIAEIQQRSDATFRLFDHGRQRDLHIESAIAVATRGPADVQVPRRRLSDERMLLVAGSHFIFERVDLAPDTAWSLDAKQETWLLVLSGGACAGSIDVTIGDAIFAQSDRVDIRAGERGMAALVAYTGGGSPAPMLLQRVGGLVAEAGRRPVTSKASPPFLTQIAVTWTLAGLGPENQRMEIIQ
jgi:mannose-6-phosphate isomerase